MLSLRGNVNSDSPLPGVYGIAIRQKLLRWQRNAWEVVRVSDGASTPLCDLRVVEISDRIAGAYCGKLFVDAGADVVKVEPAAAIRCVASPQPVPSLPTGGDSPLFSYLSAGKRSVTTRFRGSVGRRRHRDRDRHPVRLPPRMASIRRGCSRRGPTASS